MPSYVKKQRCLPRYLWRTLPAKDAETCANRTAGGWIRHCCTLLIACVQVTLLKCSAQAVALCRR